MPQLLINIAAQARNIVISAVADLGPDLRGYSVVDLVLDNVEHVSSADAKAALVIAGVDSMLSDRLVRSYNR